MLASFGQQMPHWVPAYTSERVVSVEAALVRFFRTQGMKSMHIHDPEMSAQKNAARALSSAAPLVVVEGAAGSGKTTMLQVAAQEAAHESRRLVVVAPTLIAAQEAGKAINSEAFSVHSLLRAYGFRSDEHGRWIHRLEVGETDSEGYEYRGVPERFRLDAQARIVVDEAGMVSQDLMHGLIQVAEETGASVGLVGDRAQLASPGRGGVLKLAVNNHPSPLDIDEVHRFRDKEYAALTLQMRDRGGADLFDTLLERGNIVVHQDVDSARDAIAADCVRAAKAGAKVAVAVDSNEAATVLNARIQKVRAEHGYTRAARASVPGADGLIYRIGDAVMTRANDSRLNVANRETWTVHQAHQDGSLAVERGGEIRVLPPKYVAEHTHLAYASTEHGVQGQSVDFGYGIVTEQTNAGGLYVAATRGREHNTLHVVSEQPEQARDVFNAALERERGDNGVEAAHGVVAHVLDGLKEKRVLPEGELQAKLALAEKEHARLVVELAGARETFRTADTHYSAVMVPGAGRGKPEAEWRAVRETADRDRDAAMRSVAALERAVAAAKPATVEREHEAAKQRLASALAAREKAAEWRARVESGEETIITPGIHNGHPHPGTMYRLAQAERTAETNIREALAALSAVPGARTPAAQDRREMQQRQGKVIDHPDGGGLAR
jgi:thymidine kinase